jgi:tRNA-2-methylthio-N6-dimethylallyladenosine synthase
MAERLKQKLWDSGADVVVGPDSYRHLPELLARKGKQAEVQLSWDETYEDVLPQHQVGAVSAYLSIMRGCNNMCSFCIVPFTRGRERSRSPASILNELTSLRSEGIKEVTLLGQNVNSYFF